jgi:hypothetical protein
VLFVSLVHQHDVGGRYFPILQGLDAANLDGPRRIGFWVISLQNPNSLYALFPKTIHRLINQRLSGTVKIARLPLASTLSTIDAATIVLPKAVGA